jgi:asparagine synthase (glutamine-hydrolysing)
MCAIGGILNDSANNYDSIQAARIVQGFLDKMICRGPDESRIISIGQNFIGANRLSIVDRKYGHQPIVSLCGRLAVSFNGEIYNYKQLKSLLNNHHNFKTQTDTEVLMHLFEEQNINCLNKLNGMFSICITDGKISYLIRDRLGIKPLYYKFDGSSILFASETKALISRYPTVNIETTYDQFETNVGYQTLFKGIFEIPPGSYLKYDNLSGKYSVCSYYSLSARCSMKITDENAIKKIKNMVKDAISLRTKTDLPYGCYVSGGLDSSIIAALSKPKYLFTAAVTEKEYLNEDRYVKLLEKALDTKVIQVKLEPSQFPKYFVEMVYALDFPTTSLAAFSQFVLSKEVSKYGLRVMLSGLGADEYLGGYVRHVSMMVNQDDGLRNMQYKHYNSLFSKIDNSSRNLAEKYFNLINRSEYGDKKDAAKEVENIFATENMLLNSIASTDFKISFPPLLRLDDRINMHFGIESRSPYLDYRIIEFAYSLEDMLKIRKLKNKILTKYILRKAFEKEIPTEIINREDKIGFPSPVNIWLEKDFKHVVENAYKAIQESKALTTLFPYSYDILHEKSEFSRKRWQLAQWAVWYLLFFKNKSIEETTNIIFSKNMPKESHKLEDNIKYQSPYLKVREDKVLQGGRERLYSVVERDNSVIVIPVSSSSKTILLKQYRHPTSQYSWELPMGGIDINEAPDDAVARELAEETNIKSRQITQIGKYKAVPGLTPQDVYVYTVEVTDQELQDAFCKNNADNIEDSKILSLDEVYHMVESGEITDGFTLAGLLYLKLHQKKVLPGKTVS